MVGDSVYLINTNYYFFNKNIKLFLFINIKS